MNRLALFAAVLMAQPAFSWADEEPEYLDAVVVGLLNSRDIVIKEIHPVTYLESLKIENTETILNGHQRYGLARMLLDCHHLCQALSHQGFSIRTDSAVMKLACYNFAGFKSSCSGEGGYDTNAFYDYFESGLVKWGVDSTFESQKETPRPRTANEK